MRRLDLTGSMIAGVLSAGVSLGGLSSICAAQTVAQAVPEAPADAGDALYDGPKRGETVRERSRPGYDPVGIRMGSFFLFPEIGIEEFYRDNIFYSDTGEESDFVTVVEPRASLKSNWDNHSLQFQGGVEAGRYLDNTSENYVDWDFSADGRIDIQRGFALTGGGWVERNHEDRRSVDQVGAGEPVTFYAYGLQAGAVKRFNRLYVRADLASEWFAYDNVDAAGGGSFRSSDRDRRVLEGSVRSGYSVSERLEPFVELAVNDRSYDQRVDDNGFERDSQGWEATVGTAFDLTGVTFGEVYAGYLSQDYDRDGFDTITGFSFGGALTWNPTGLTTVTAEAARTVEETTLSGASGALASAIDLRVDHELRRNVILFGTAGYTTIEYQDISRDDDLVNAGLGVTYLANEFLKLDMSYSNAHRDSTANGSDYNTQTVRFRVTGRL